MTTLLQLTREERDHATVAGIYSVDQDADGYIDTNRHTPPTPAPTLTPMPTPTPSPTPTPAVPEVYVRVSAAVQLARRKAAHIAIVEKLTTDSTVENLLRTAHMMCIDIFDEAVDDFDIINELRVFFELTPFERPPPPTPPPPKPLLPPPLRLPSASHRCQTHGAKSATCRAASAPPPSFSPLTSRPPRR